MLVVVVIVTCTISCRLSSTQAKHTVPDSAIVQPVVITEKVFEDSDDPAIWIDSLNPSQSLIIGTDKHTANGGVYVFTLDGKIDRKRSVTGLKRVNNADVAYGLQWGDTAIDIVAATERDRNMIRIFSLPDMKVIDGGGIEVFTGEQQRSPMGIAFYTRPSDHAVFVIVSRKEGPAENYLEQYLLTASTNGTVEAKLVRKFGQFSGKKEIESIAVDNELGYVYYSDEQFGIRKYYADPEKGNKELAVFGKGEYLEDNEGISIYKLDAATGYILVSNQSANTFNVYHREGSSSNPHEHKKITEVAVKTNQSDGSDVTSVSLPGFEGGLFVAMSTDSTFQLYRWKDIAEKAGLKLKK
ncbi:MAG: phytase [Chitinophagaceae bacterium]|nr:phytase [Chitinophagaceae bacterium]